MSRRSRQERILRLIRQGLPDEAVRASTGATWELIALLRQGAEGSRPSPADPPGGRPDKS